MNDDTLNEWLERLAKKLGAVLNGDQQQSKLVAIDFAIDCLLSERAEAIAERTALFSALRDLLTTYRALAAAALTSAPPREDVSVELAQWHAACWMGPR